MNTTSKNHPSESCSHHREHLLLEVSTVDSKNNVLLSIQDLTFHAPVSQQDLIADLSLKVLRGKNLLITGSAGKGTEFIPMQTAKDECTECEQEIKEQNLNKVKKEHAKLETVIQELQEELQQSKEHSNQSYPEWSKRLYGIGFNKSDG